MTTAAIRQKLYDYIRVAEEKKIKAIYTIFQNEIESKYEHWKDESFVKEVEKRSSEYKNGNVAGIPWNEAKARILSKTGRNKK